MKFPLIKAKLVEIMSCELVLANIICHFVWSNGFTSVQCSFTVSDFDFFNNISGQHHLLNFDTIVTRLQDFLS